MPLYLITIKTWEGKVIKGVRQHDNPSLEVVYRIYEEKTIHQYGRVKAYDCFMICKMSTWYSVYMHMLEKQDRKRRERPMTVVSKVVPIETDFGKSKGPGKYRTDKEGPQSPKQLGSSTSNGRNTIIFKAFFGDEEKIVELSQPVGHPGDGYFVTIGGRYHGVLLRRNGEWTLPNAPDDITSDDVLILGDRITEYEHSLF
jgi:hypothetical protein